MISSDEVFNIYKSFERKHKKEVRDINFLIQPYNWKGPIEFQINDLEELDVWVDFKQGSLTSMLTEEFTNRKAKNYANTIIKNYDSLKCSHSDYIEYLEKLRLFVLSRKPIPPILILEESTNKKNGNIVDGMHRIVTFLILIYKHEIPRDSTLIGYLGSK